MQLCMNSATMKRFFRNKNFTVGFILSLIVLLRETP